MQRVKAGTAALVLTGHLPHDNLGIGVNVEFPGLERNRVLQGFHQRCVFSDIIVLVADPLRNPHRTFSATADHDSNTRRPGIPQATAIHIRHQFGYHFFKLLCPNAFRSWEVRFRTHPYLAGDFPDCKMRPSDNSVKTII